MLSKFREGSRLTIKEILFFNVVSLESLDATVVENFIRAIGIRVDGSR
jgi:hypothetical protein